MDGLLIPRIARVLFGASCVGCGASSLEPVCSACAAELRRAPIPAGATWSDIGAAGRLVRRAKHGGWRSGARVLAPFVLARLGGAEALAERVDCITWVPSDPRRSAARGVHLPEQLACELGSNAGIPARGLLVRTRGRPAQRGLDRSSRARNAVGLFRLRFGATPWGRLLLLDDVRTTGASLHDAVRALEPVAADITTHALLTVGGSSLYASNSSSRTGALMPMQMGTAKERQPPG